MSARHEARMWAVQFLFQCDFNPTELDNALEDFWPERSPTGQMKAFTEDLIRGVLNHHTELDGKLQSYAQNWELKRMGAVDRNVMRVALYEMMYRSDIPPVVSINEAVDLAKELSSEESGKFVNGVLDRARKDLDRPARAAARKSAPSTGK
jgi:transcription antitermination protein NusB